MGTIIGLAMGAGAVIFILWIMSKTFYSIGNFGIFTGGKSRFSGVADTKYTCNRISLIECRNLNGSVRKEFKISKLGSYRIESSIIKKSGEAKIELKDKNGDNICDFGNGIKEEMQLILY